MSDAWMFTLGTVFGGVVVFALLLLAGRMVERSELKQQLERETRDADESARRARWDNG